MCKGNAYSEYQAFFQAHLATTVFIIKSEFFKMPKPASHQSWGAKKIFNSTPSKMAISAFSGHFFMLLF